MGTFKMPTKGTAEETTENAEATQAANLLETEVETPEEEIPTATEEDGSEAGDPAEGEVVELSQEEIDKQAQENYETRLHDAEQKYISISTERSELQERLKYMKKSEQTALELITDIKARGWQYFRVKPTKTPATVESGEVTSENAISDTQPLADQPTAWRKASIDELDLTGKFMEKLKESGITTIGDLIDLKERISLNRDQWPKGVGEAKITKIDDALELWLENNQPLITGDNSDPPALTVVTAEDVDMGESVHQDTDEPGVVSEGEEVDPDEFEADEDESLEEDNEDAELVSLDDL